MDHPSQDAVACPRPEPATSSGSGAFPRPTVTIGDLSSLVFKFAAFNAFVAMLLRGGALGLPPAQARRIALIIFAVVNGLILLVALISALNAWMTDAFWYCRDGDWGRPLRPTRWRRIYFFALQAVTVWYSVTWIGGLSPGAGATLGLRQWMGLLVMLLWFLQNSQDPMRIDSVRECLRNELGGSPRWRRMLLIHGIELTVVIILVVLSCILVVWNTTMVELALISIFLMFLLLGDTTFLLVAILRASRHRKGATSDEPPGHRP